MSVRPPVPVRALQSQVAVASCTTRVPVQWEIPPGPPAQKHMGFPEFCMRWHEFIHREQLAARFTIRHPPKSDPSQACAQGEDDPVDRVMLSTGPVTVRFSPSPHPSAENLMYSRMDTVGLPNIVEDGSCTCLLGV